MKIRPLHDRILVKRLAEVEKTAGGLYIPDTAKEKPIEAKVIAVGAHRGGERVAVGEHRAHARDLHVVHAPARRAVGHVVVDGERLGARAP